MNRTFLTIKPYCINLSKEILDSRGRAEKLENVITKFAIKFGSRDPRTAKFGERPVRIGPRFSKFSWFWSGPGPSCSRIFKILSVLVRAGFRFLKFFRSWSGLRFLFFLGLDRTRTEPFGPGQTAFGRWNHNYTLFF